MKTLNNGGSVDEISAAQNAHQMLTKMAKANSLIPVGHAGRQKHSTY